MMEVIVIALLLAALITAMSDEERRALLQAVRSFANDARRRFFQKAQTPPPRVDLTGVSSPSITLDLAIPGTLVEEAASCMRETLDPIEAFNRLRLRRQVASEEARAALKYALRTLLEGASCGPSSRHHCS